MRSQKGSAHVIIIVILIVVILGLLGLVLWQNFLKPKPATATANSAPIASSASPVTSSSIMTSLKTFTANHLGISFEYPSTFTVSEDDSMYTADAIHTLKATIANQAGDTVATLQTDREGGYTCAGAPVFHYTILSSEKIQVLGVSDTAPAYFNSYVTQIPNYLRADNTGYQLSYGIDSQSLTPGDVDYDCDAHNGVYFVGLSFDTAGTPENSFGLNTIHDVGTDGEFPTIAAAKQYVASDEYAQIKAMIESVSFAK